MSVPGMRNEQGVGGMTEGRDHNSLNALSLFLNLSKQCEAIWEERPTSLAAEVLHAVAEETAQGRPPSVKVVLAKVGRSRTGVKNQIKQLHRKQLLTSRESEEDRRRKKIELTPKGEKVLSEIHSAVVASIRSYLGHKDEVQDGALLPGEHLGRGPVIKPPQS